MTRLKSATRPFSADRSRGHARSTPFQAGRTCDGDRRTIQPNRRRPAGYADHGAPPAGTRDHRRRTGQGEHTMRRAPVSRWWNNCSQEPWNHNLHYHRVIVNVIPPDCRRALDVGCGQGALTRDLRRFVPEVAGIDRDERSIALARAHAGAAGIGYVRGDFQAAPIRPCSVDLITSVASLHHMDTATGLRRMADLLRPGGTLV